MIEEGKGINLNSLEASQGRILGLEIAVIQMMRVISQGLQGEDAYQHLSRGLRADAENLHAAPGELSKAAESELTYLASIFEQQPKS